MGNLNEFFRDLGRNAYGLGENVASLGSAAIAEPVAGFAAMYDPANGAQAIREGMTYTPRTQAGQMYQQGAARTLGAIAKPAMPVIETWQRGVDIAGGYSPAAGAMLRTVPAAIGVAMGAKPALQAGRQVSNSLGAMQARMIANANAPRTLNAGYMGQRGAVDINALRVGDTVSSHGYNYDVRDIYNQSDFPYNPVNDNGDKLDLGFSVKGSRLLLQNQETGKYQYGHPDYVNPPLPPQKQAPKLKGSLSEPKEGYARIVHGSWESDPFTIGNGGRFGGVFGQKNYVEPAYDRNNYYVDIPEAKILTQQDINYHIPAEKQIRAVEDVSGIKRTNPDFEKVFDAIAGDKNQQGLEDIFGMDNWGDASWHAQRLRGQFAKKLGYDAVHMDDETGTSILVVKNAKLKRLNK